MSAPVPPYRWATVIPRWRRRQQALEEAFTTAWEEGQDLPPDHAVVLALGTKAR